MIGTISSFFCRYGFPYSGLNINAVIDSLLYDMTNGLQYAPGVSDASMGMYPNWIAPPSAMPANTSVIVIDAGGTNFRSCLVTFDGNGTPHISDFEKQRMPGVDREYTCDGFFDAMAAFLDRLKGKSSTIGFCFSYALEILENRDGKILSLAKELRAPDVPGHCAGACLADALVRRGWERPDTMVLLNDTAAAVFAAAAVPHEGRSYSSYAGLILGTGMNIAYIESEPIQKIPDGRNVPDRQIVVCESGMFDKLHRSAFDIAFDKTTASQGSYVFEKMCAGAYLGGVILTVLQYAADDRVFSETVCAAVKKTGALSLQDIGEFLERPFDTSTHIGKIAAAGTPLDRHLLFALTDACIERTARLVAALVSAVVIKSGCGKLPAEPVCILYEGTTFYRTYKLKERVTGYLNRVLTEERCLYYELVTVENAVVIGSAVAAAGCRS